MRTLRTYLVSAGLIASCSLMAQQEVMVSQYMFNGLFLNPAYAGSHPYASASLLHREQWTGMPGAPSTSMFAIDAPVWKDKVGAGLSVVHDRIGVTRETDIATHYSYSIRVSEGSRLAFGLRAGLSLYSAQLGDLVYWDENDPLYAAAIRNTPVGRFGTGLYWHSRTSYVGLSIPTLVALDDDVAEASRSTLDDYFTQHFYLHAGHVFEINEHFDVKPSVLVKYQQDAPPQVDLNCNVLFRDRIWLGAGYRTGDAVVAMLEYQLTSMVRAGYAYDMNTSALGPYNGGSHEVMIGFDLGKEPIRIRSPRYF
ncbi:MAG: type IX secretion system membrane protein PorP/SprF [Flavobacteriales bacterium]|nr:type IX secretion system membrane protein PorP/SprF [Flavobacteriales bacterium]